MRAQTMPALFADYVAEYRSTTEQNDAIYEAFTDAVSHVPFLLAHRAWVEENAWGFGDRAFHWMWYRLLGDEVLTRPHPRLLEIGVYKGQVISLWALIARQMQRSASITAVSPLAGTGRASGVMHRLKLRLSASYRARADAGDLYRDEDYRAAIARIFRRFDLDVDSIRLIKGYSQDAAVAAQLRGESFDLIYIDGGHRYEDVRSDIALFSPMVSIGGYIVFDDAMALQPGGVFFKGHAGVSRAVEELDTIRYRNVLNVGHNRIFQRIN